MLERVLILKRPARVSTPFQAEFLTGQKELSRAELQGRLTGSLEWRRQRGELGGAAQ